MKQKFKYTKPKTMKTIELFEASILINGKDTDISTLELIKNVLDSPPEKGFTRSDLKKRSRIDLAIEKANGKLELEDADFQTLQEAVLSMHWAVRHRFIVDFIEQFEKQ